MTNISIHTRDFNKNSRSVAKLIDEVLLNGIPDDVPYMEEWLLSQALCKGYNTPEKEAKKALKKHGSENIKQALKLKSRKNYAGDTGASQVYDDLVELAENTGIATHQFAKFLFLKERNTLVRGLVYFFEHASDEEKEHFFTHGYYLEDKDLYVFNVIRILLSDETLKVLFKVLQQFSEKVAKKYSVKALFTKTIRNIAFLTFPFFIIILFWGPQIFSVVFSKEWREAGVYAQYLTPWLFFSTIASPVSQVPLTLGYVKTNMFAGIINNFLLVMIFVVASQYYSDPTYVFLWVGTLMPVFYIVILLWFYRIILKYEKTRITIDSVEANKIS